MKNYYSPSKQIVIYLAAALFNARETYFNSCLVEKLEKIGYKINFPQRDGFEFGNLKKAFFEKLPQEEISSAVQNVIYFLDMGFFVPKSDIVLANFDEPSDEGVVVEVSYAKLMEKFVIGVRTDVRSPYGSSADKFGGMHFFPAYQSNKFISHYMPSRNIQEREEQMNSLIKKIEATISESRISHNEILPEYLRQNHNISMIFEGANLLFEKISDIHSDEGLETIASRYIKHKKRLEEIGPKI